MPNWVRNKVKFGTDKVLKDCVIEERGRREFDFNKIIPMPKELEEEGGLEKLTLEQRLVFLKENGGCDNWYDWSIKHWGTKWNANDTIVVNDYEVVFDTAWSTPDTIFRAISAKYNTTVEVDYADESIGTNCGKISYDNGEEIDYEDKDGDEGFSAAIWGWDDED